MKILHSAHLMSLATTVTVLSCAPPMRADSELPAFTEQTDAAGLTFQHQTLTPPSGFKDRHRMTPGVAVADFNNDGWLDLFVQAGLGYNSRLFINQGGGVFSDEAAAWGIELTGDQGAAAAAADFDGNGHVDIYAGTLDGPNRLLLNSGGFFTEVGADANVATVFGLPFNTFGAAPGDIDLDGDIDMVTVEWTALSQPIGNLLFLNEGNAIFTESTSEAGLFESIGLPFRWGFTAALVDLDGDRWPDLPVAADFGTSRYYQNLGDSSFEWIGDNGTGSDENGMGSALGDYDNDGDLDWFVTSIFDDDGKVEGNWGTTGNRLYRNDGSHQFTDVSEIAGVRNGGWGWGASFADFNNDGLLDLAMTNGFCYLPSGSNPDPTFNDDPSRLWLNTGNFAGATFVEAATDCGLIHTECGKGLVSFDADNDGDLDMVITSNLQALAYFRNDSTPTTDRWLQLELQPPPGNAPQGLGAKVEVTVDGITYHRALFGNPSFMSQEPMRIHVGFPAAPMAESVVVGWPDGAFTAMTGVPTGQVLTVRRGDLNGDAVVDVTDLSMVILNWDACPAAACPGDGNLDGTVDVVDLIDVLLHWD